MRDEVCVFFRRVPKRLERAEPALAAQHSLAGGLGWPFRKGELAPVATCVRERMLVEGLYVFGGRTQRVSVKSRFVNGEFFVAHTTAIVL